MAHLRTLLIYLINKVNSTEKCGIFDGAVLQDVTTYSLQEITHQKTGILIYSGTRLKRHRFRRCSVYSVRYSAEIFISLVFTITLHF